MNILTKLFLKFFPDTFLNLLAKKQGINNRKLDWSVKLFGDCKRIDIFRTAAPGRGFILTLDKKLQLFFYQDGDHFSFDGFEMGEYDEGDVTIFDGIKQ